VVKKSSEESSDVVDSVKIGWVLDSNLVNHKLAFMTSTTKTRISGTQLQKQFSENLFF
jgi:hypothetical protein